jgi:hypothetical protein
MHLLANAALEVPFCCRNAATEYSPGQVRSTQPWVTERKKTICSPEGATESPMGIPFSNASSCIMLERTGVRVLLYAGLATANPLVQLPNSSQLPHLRTHQRPPIRPLAAKFFR